MIIALYGPDYREALDILKGKKSFVNIGLKDAARRFCDQIFDFKVSNLWNDKKLHKSDKRYCKDLDLNQDLTPEYALHSLISWGNSCDKSIWADYAINIAKTLTEDTEFDDVANYSFANGLEYKQLGSYQKVKNVCLTEITSLDEIDKMIKNQIKVIYVGKETKDYIKCSNFINSKENIKKQLEKALDEK